MTAMNKFEQFSVLCNSYLICNSCSDSCVLAIQLYMQDQCFAVAHIFSFLWLYFLPPVHFKMFI